MPWESRSSAMSDKRRLHSSSSKCGVAASVVHRFHLNRQDNSDGLTLKLADHTCLLCVFIESNSPFSLLISPSHNSTAHLITPQHQPQRPHHQPTSLTTMAFIRPFKPSDTEACKHIVLPPPPPHQPPQHKPQLTPLSQVHRHPPPHPPQRPRLRPLPRPVSLDPPLHHPLPLDLPRPRRRTSRPPSPPPPNPPSPTKLTPPPLTGQRPSSRLLHRHPLRLHPHLELPHLHHHRATP